MRAWLSLMWVSAAVDGARVLGFVRREPVVVHGLVQAALVFACAYGLRLTPGQIAATMALTEALLAIFVTRPAVTANANLPPKDPSP